MPARIVVESVGVTEALVRNTRRMTRLADMRPAIDEAVNIIHEQTRQWMDSSGEGEWPPLAESTIQRKAQLGAAEPSRPLYEWGNLYDSVTSDSGPYSFHHRVSNHEEVIGADWDENGWQIPVVLSEGTTTAGRNRNITIPPRPIWPREGSQADGELRAQVTATILGLMAVLH